MRAQTQPIEQRASTRITHKLLIRRVNVDVAGGVIATRNISRDGADLICPADRFSALQRQLETPRVSLVIELPTGRDIHADVDVLYHKRIEDEYLIAVQYRSFKHSDAVGWRAYIDLITSPRVLAEVI